MGTGPLYRA